MSSNFKVEDNIPITKKAVARNRSPLREALAGLEIGQCVTVYPDEGQTLKQLRGRLSGLTQGAKEDNPGAAYVHRTVDTDEGQAMRIWRVAPEDAPAPVAKPAAKKKAASKKKAAAKQENEPAPGSKGPEDERPYGEQERTEDEAAGREEPTDEEIEQEEQHEAAKTLDEGDDEDDPFGGELEEDEEQEEMCSNCGMDLNLEGKCDNEDCPECEDYDDPFGEDED